MKDKTSSDFLSAFEFKRLMLSVLFAAVVSSGIVKLYGNEDKATAGAVKPEFMEILNTLSKDEKEKLLNLRRKSIVKFRMEVLKIQNQKNKQKANERKKEIIRMLKAYEKEQDDKKKAEMLENIRQKIAEGLAEKIRINEAKIKRLSRRLEKLKKTIEFYKEHEDSAVDKTLQYYMNAAGIKSAE
jgi:hypothetical protein